MKRKREYGRRVEQRTLLARLGLAVAIIAGAGFIISIMLLLFTDLSSEQLNGLVGVSQYGISFGLLFALVFGRLGWSEHVIIDFLLNRISIVFVVTGFVVIIVGDIQYHSSSLIWVGAILGGGGILLALLGIRYQTIPSNDILKGTENH